MSSTDNRPAGEPPATPTEVVLGDFIATVLDRLQRGETPGSLVRSMKLAPFRAETLARQARAWTADELDAALGGLVELDAQVKGVGGRSSGEARDRLAFDLWITDRVAPG